MSRQVRGFGTLLYSNGRRRRDLECATVVGLTEVSDTPVGRFWSGVLRKYRSEGPGVRVGVWCTGPCSETETVETQVEEVLELETGLMLKGKKDERVRGWLR